MSVADSTPRVTARRNLAAVGCFAAFGLGLSAVHALTGFGLGCPWRQLTGTLCPFCGATRMGADLLVGDVPAAWAANPFVFVALCLLGLAALSWTVTALGGPRVRPPGRLAHRRTWILLTAVTALIFMVVRNLAPL